MPSTLIASKAPWQGPHAPARRGTPAASETYKVGDPLIRDSNGKLAIAATSGNNVGSGDIVGTSLHNAADILTGTYTPDGMGPYAPWLPGFRASLPLYHGTPASAVMTEAVLDLPTDLELRNEGGIWCLDVSATSNPKFRVESIAPGYAYSETYAQVNCVLLPAADTMDAVA